MQKFLSSYIFLPFLLIFAACSGSDGGGVTPEPDEGAPITLHSSFAEPVKSKSSRTATPLEDVVDNFAVRAIKTIGGGTQVVMGSPSDLSAAYTVRHVSGRWGYAGIGNQTLRFWDMAASGYTFSAYAPASISATFTADCHVCIPSIQGNVPDSDCGPLIARLSRVASASGCTDTDLVDSRTLLTGHALPSEVGLVFHPLLAKVEFRIFTGGDPFTVTSVEIGGSPIAVTGTYASASDSWSETTSATTLAQASSSILVDGTTTATSSLLYSALELPQTLADGEKITVTLVIDGEEVAVDIDSQYVDWQSNNVYIYYLTYIPGDPQLILVSITTEPWQQGDPVDDTQTNW